MNKESMKKIWNKKIKLTRFWTGLGMQLFQATLVTIFIFSLLDWTWFKIKYVYMVGGAVVFVGFNIVSWYLMISGLKEEK